MAVVGVGQELNGDDAAGVKVAQTLSRRQRVGLSDALRPVPVSLLVVEAAHAPENCTGAIRRFAPDLVLLVDAAEMGDPPGTIRWLAWQDTGDLGGSTHTLPPFMLAKFLATEFTCEVALIGIQRQDTRFGAPISPPVRRAVRAVVRELAALLLTSEGRTRSAPR